MNLSERKECRPPRVVLPQQPTTTLCPTSLVSGALEPPGSRSKGAALVSGESRARSGHPRRGNRVYFLDNLRTFVIFLVVVCHAGLVYESSGVGASFWIVDDPATNNLAGLINLILDILMMPALFFISGYFAPASRQRRGDWTLIKERFTRLVLPWSVAVLTLIPLYKVIFLSSRNLPQTSWFTYFHVSNGIISQSWLWFLPVLFLFHVLYLLLSRVPVPIPPVSLRVAVLGAFVMGFVYSTGMDLLGLQGWTKIKLLDFQNERLLIYFLMFLLGVFCFRHRAFDAKPKGRALYALVNAVAWIPVTVYIGFLLYPWFHPGSSIVSAIIDRLILWFSYQLSLLCLLYVLIETFRRYQNKPGKLREELNRNSYYVYLIHVIVLGTLAWALLDTALPSLWKYLVLTVSTYAACNLVVSSCRRALRYRTAWGL
jgi:fucose 4-O-acetylase-like acetyltransferase